MTILDPIKPIGDAPRWNIARVGGDSGRGIRLELTVLAGGGFRQGAHSISMERAVGQDHVWDGNPDAGLKIGATNRAANASSEGAVRGLDISARNRGDNLAWAHGGNINARNDSGSSIDELQGIGTRIENYGALATSIIGIDVNLSDESNAGGAHTVHGIRIRNTDQSAQPVVDAALLISHTSTNGFDALIEAAAAAGDGFVVSTATPSGAATHAMIVEINGTKGYIPVYAAVGFGG